MAAAPLTTVVKVRYYLKIEDRDSDALLEQLIRSVSSDVVTETGRELALGDRTEIRNGNGRSSICLRNYPVASVTSLTVDGETIDPRSAENPCGYVIAGGERDELALVGLVFSRGIANVEIVYRAGYETIPEDLEQAVIELVALRYGDRDHVGVSQKSIDGQLTDFRGGSQLAYAKAVLERYRRPADLG